MDDLESLFPGLRGSGYLVTSPADIRYNCVAWAAEDEEHWWWPDEDSYWPEGVAREETIAALVAAFEKLGFVPCNGPLLEEAYEKVAIHPAPDGIPTHVARQLPSGLWSSCSVMPKPKKGSNIPIGMLSFATSNARASRS